MTLKQSDTYCNSPFAELYCSNDGQYKACCDSAPSGITINDMTPFEFWDSEYMQDLRFKMNNNIKVPACQICYNQEKNNDISIRSRMNKNKRDPIIVKLHIGNYCNLSCYMCHPTNSSTRDQELKGLDTQKFFNTTIKNFTSSELDTYIQSIVDNSDRISEISIIGGEPLLMPKTKKIIEKIPDNIAKNIILHITTNLTEVHGTVDLVQANKKFKKLTLNVSCDHFGEKLEFIRYPIDSKKFEQNLDFLNQNNIEYKIACTVSLLNVFDLEEISKYYNHEIKFFELYDPYFLSPTILPDTLKNELTFAKSGLGDLYSKTGTLNDWNLAQYYLDELSDKREIDWRNIFYDLIDKINIEYKRRIPIYENNL